MSRPQADTEGAETLPPQPHPTRLLSKVHDIVCPKHHDGVVSYTAINDTYLRALYPSTYLILTTIYEEGNITLPTSDSRKVGAARLRTALRPGSEREAGLGEQSRLASSNSGVYRPLKKRKTQKGDKVVLKGPNIEQRLRR